MDEKAAFICGATFKTRFPDGEYKILAAPISTVDLVPNGIIPKKNKRQQINLLAKIGGKKYPLRFQTTPLILSKKRPISKGKFQFTVLDFDYASQLDPDGANKTKNELKLLDNKIIDFLNISAKKIWPDKDLCYEEIVASYEGFTSVRKWTPTQSAQPQVEPQESVADAIIEDIDGDLKLVYEQKEVKVDGGGKFSYEPTGLKIEPKKRKQMEPETPQTIEYPPQLTIFPRSKKEQLCKVLTLTGKPVMLSALTQGLESVQVFEICLIEDAGKIKPSCTGIEINLKEDHREPSSHVAKSVYVPVLNE